MLRNKDKHMLEAGHPD